MLSDLGRDVRYALRSLLRTPTLTITVIATLSLGIGANAVIFSAVDAVLLRDAPVSGPETLVDVFTTSGNNPYSSTSYPDYFDLRDSGTFASLAAYTAVSMTMDAGGTAGTACRTTGERQLLRSARRNRHRRPRLTPEDDRIGAPVRVAVISHALWRRLFNADPIRDRPDPSSQQQSLHARRRRATRVRGPAARRRDGCLGSHRTSARDRSAGGGRAPGARNIRRSSTSAAREG